MLQKIYAPWPWLLLLLAGLAMPLWAGSPATVRVQIGKNMVEMPDTSDAQKGLDLSAYELTPVYEADFSKTLKMMREDDLLVDGKRVRQPENEDWVLEGKANAFTRNGRLHLQNTGSHLVCWNTREFPGDFLLEFGVSPTNSQLGLGIVFFAARGTNGGSIFDLDQRPRQGDFQRYHSGGINCYHVSYWATDPAGSARGTAHIRKNAGFHLVAMGRDFVAGQGPGPHRIRILKTGGDMAIECNGKISVRFADDGKAYGPVLGGGRIGLRQMEYSGECAYTHFKVWQVKPRPQPR